MTERRLEHLDPETIAALVDRTLEPAARAAAEAHLAECADCREVWVETSEMAGAIGTGVAANESAASPNVVPHRPRSRRWIYAGAGLAMAAAVALTVFAPRLFDQGPRPELRELVEAVGANRRAEGRLTGGFVWGPAPSATRSGDSSPAVPADVAVAAAELRLAAERKRDAGTLAAAGTAYLIEGRIDEAIAALEESTDLSGDSASVWSDLSAAYLARANYPSRAMDLPRALESAERALQIEAEISEALFNRALALERLGLKTEAARAWREYIVREKDPGWKAEAEHRLAAIESPGTSSDAQLLRERLFDELLPAYAAVAKGEEQRAAVFEARRQLDSLSTDRYASDVITHALSTSSSAVLKGIAAYGRARAAYRRDAFEAALPDFLTAYQFLADQHSPLALQADLYVGIIEYRRQALPAAEGRLLNLARAVDRERYPSVAGRIYWTAGLIAALDGRRPEALGRYQTARDALTTANERANAAFVDGLIATSFDRMGDPARSWTARVRALQGNPSEGALFAAAEAAKRLAWLHVAARLQQAGIERARAAGRDVSVADGHRVLAVTWAALGRPGAARESIARARTVVTDRSGSAWDRARAELDLTETELAASGAADTTHAGALAATYFAAPGTATRLPAIHLARARLLIARGDRTAARAELRQGFAQYQQLRAKLTDPQARATFADVVRDLGDEWSLLEIADADTREALMVLEAARAGDLAIAEPRSTLPPLPNGVTGIEYLVTKSRTYIWIVRGSRIEFEQRLVGSDQLRTWIRNVTPPRQDPEARRQLTNALIAPALAHAASTDTLLVVADGPLHQLAFALLGGQSTTYVIEEHPILYVPALTLAPKSGMSSVPGYRVLAIGNPQFDTQVFSGLPALPRAEAEAAQVGALYGHSTVLLGGRADRATVLALMPQANVVHFAGHAIVNDFAPDESTLIIGDVGIQARDIGVGSLRNTHVVVLAACRSGSGFLSRSEGALGLSRAFLRAGAKMVLANLWPADDAATEALSTRFHQAFIRTADVAQALREAQVSFIRSNEIRLNEPSSWAGLKAIGAATFAPAPVAAKRGDD